MFSITSEQINKYEKKVSGLYVKVSRWFLYWYLSYVFLVSLSQASVEVGDGELKKRAVKVEVTVPRNFHF